MALKICFIALVLVSLTVSAWGHGYMIEPPSRNACYKQFSRKCRANYNANGQNCGGREVQISFGGKCGVCGDKYGVSRHVYPGKYATGFITKTYKQKQEITAKIQITANHKGWFEFRIGDIGSPPIKQEKLEHLLKTTDGKTRVPLRGSGNSLETIKLRLPSGLTCNHCVLQWWWKVGNSWGCDSEGCGKGHGAQETFVNCADVKIVTEDGIVPSTDAPLPTTQILPIRTTKAQSSTGTPQSTRTPPPTETMPPTVTFPPTKTPPPPPTIPPTPGRCKSTGAWAGQASIDGWCAVNCAAGFCPAHMCICTKTSPPPPTNPPTLGRCRSTGAWAGRVDIDGWCAVNCAAGFCPAHMCICR